MIVDVELVNDLAIRRAYGVADLIHWEDVYFRKDIGAKALRRVK